MDDDIRGWQAPRTEAELAKETRFANRVFLIGALIVAVVLGLTVGTFW